MIKQQYVQSYRGARATGEAEAAAPVSQIVQGSTWARRCPFFKNCTLKHLCYKHEFKLRIVFQSNLA